MLSSSARSAADLSDIGDVVHGDADHLGPLAGGLDDVFLLQAAQGFPDGRAAHAQALTELELREHVSPGVLAGEDGLLQLVEYLIRDGDDAMFHMILLITACAAGRRSVPRS